MSISNRTVQNQIMTESVAPTLSSISPVDSASSTSCTTTITVTFSEAMKLTSVTSNTDNTSCSGSIQISGDSFGSCVRMTSGDPTTSDNRTFTVTPSSALSNSSTFKIKVTTGSKDPSGNPMSSDNTTGTGFNTAGDSGKNGC
mgnify:FL=1